ncbi:MAG: DUF4116 domain-containing protein [Legionella sp.]|uniref:DUF4116 domain-containing protein n=1 Tax=Legionella sp. TaxID=459 RepID=UPI0039E2E25D
MLTNIQNYEQIFKELLNDGMKLKNFSKDIQDDIEAVRIAVTNNGLALKFASWRLRGIEELALIAIENDPRAFRYISPRLQKSKNILQKVKEHPSTNDELMKNILQVEREVHIKELEEDGMRLANFPVLQDDIEAARVAINNNGLAFEFVSKRLRENKKLALDAIEGSPQAFRFIAPALKMDQDILHEVKKYLPPNDELMNEILQIEKNIRELEQREKNLESQEYHSIQQLQRKYRSRFAQKKLLQFLKDEEKHNVEKVFEPQLSDDSLLKARELFQETASHLTFYGRHAVKTTDSFFSILANQSIWSSKTLRARNINAPSINSPSDLTEGADYFAFLGMGTKQEGLPAPGFLEHSPSYFIFNMDNFAQQNPWQMKHFILKGCDWGNFTTRDIQLTESEKIHVNYRSTREDRSQNVICYTYKGNSYSLNRAEEMICGADFKKEVPVLVLRHLAHLPEHLQKEILSPVLSAEDEASRKKVVSDIIQRFYPFEGSLGGAIPLSFQCLDVIKFPYGPEVNLDILKSHIHQGNSQKVTHFFNSFPVLKAVSFILEGAAAMARAKGHKDIEQYCQDLLKAKEMVSYLPFSVNSQQFTEARTIIKNINLHEKYTTQEIAEYYLISCQQMDEVMNQYSEYDLRYHLLFSEAINKKAELNKKATFVKRIEPQLDIFKLKKKEMQLKSEINLEYIPALKAIDEFILQIERAKKDYIDDKLDECSFRSYCLDTAKSPSLRKVLEQHREWKGVILKFFIVLFGLENHHKFGFFAKTDSIRKLDEFTDKVENYDTPVRNKL